MFPEFSDSDLTSSYSDYCRHVENEIRRNDMAIRGFFIVFFAMFHFFWWPEEKWQKRTF
jgi:hypothetical protein